MDYHVLVLALSTLPNALTQGKMKKAEYQLKNKLGEFEDGQVEGLGQMEVIPLYISKVLNTNITHIIVLATTQVKNPIDSNTANAQGACESIAEFYGSENGPFGMCLDMSDLKTISHLEFFKRRLAHEGLSAVIEDIGVDVYDPSDGLSNLQKRIRDLYRECVQSDGDWKLWLDTHGGFRETSAAMFGLMQVLAAPDEQDYADYSENDRGIKEAIAHLSDGRDTIPVTAVYGVEYDPTGAAKGLVQPILDRTDFYRTFTKPAIEAYLNYGQYGQIVLRPDAITDENGNILPYSFISYKRLDAPKERYTFLGTLRKLGYRYWYDDGIEVGQAWQDELEEHVSNCSVFIALVTRGYFGSYRCVCELRQAIDKKRRIILATIDETSLSNLKQGVTVAHHDDAEDTVTITQEEMKELLNQQQLNLRNHIMEGVLQTRLEDRLISESELASTKKQA